MRQPQAWQDTVKLPVISKNNKWSQGELENSILEAAVLCARYCQKRNRGVINMCLSGGLDSSLNLAMVRYRFPKATIQAFTIGGSFGHADVRISPIVAKKFKVRHFIYIPDSKEISAAKKEMAEIFGKQEKSDGDIGVYLLYKEMAKLGISAILAHDGIDELMGGYWEHRSQPTEARAKEIFEKIWDELSEKHLLPLEQTANRWGISVIFPYLQEAVIRCVSRIPLSLRTSQCENKMPLRRLAEKYGVPLIVLQRKKKGFCDAIAIE